jgi:lysophospholipase L1-like esterase
MATLGDILAVMPAGHRRSLSIALAAGSMAALLLGAGPRIAHGATAPDLASGPYVALGDSYTSGPLIPVQQGTPPLCFRSDHNYPSLVAQALHPAALRDVSCSGAATRDMTQPQPLPSPSLPLESNPPQLDALTPEATLVTVGIGGNDIGFGSIVVTCAALSPLDPLGAPCQQHYTAGGVDQIAQAIGATAPRIASVLAGIHQRSPRATVLLVGYLDILPASGPGCYPLVPVAAGDVAYLNRIEQDLNGMLARQASTGDAAYVDAYTPSIGHDVCQLPGTRWVEGILPTSPAFPVHPNELGMRSVADQVLAGLPGAAVHS